MPVTKQYPQAGLALYPDGTKKIVVAGDSRDDLSTFIMDVDTEIWLPGPPLPKSIYQGASVPFGESFLIVGGHGNENGILYFDPVTVQWVERTEQLAVTRNQWHAGFMVPDSHVSCF